VRPSIQDPTDAFPLAPTQQEILLHGALSPGTGAYLLQCRYDMRGPMDPARLWRAWHAVLRRHGMLRAAFARVFGSVALPGARQGHGSAATSRPGRNRRWRGTADIRRAATEQRAAHATLEREGAVRNRAIKSRKPAPAATPVVFQRIEGDAPPAKEVIERVRVLARRLR
jgi:hypothetical protein